MYYRRFSKILLFFVLSLLVTSAISAQIWSSIGLISVIPDAGVNAGSYFMKIHSVDPVEQIVTFTIKQGGREIDQGYVTFDESFVMPEQLKVELVGFAETQRYGHQARLRVSSWIEGEFTRINLPNEFYIGERYNLWAIIKNTGSREALFQIKLTQAGDYVKATDMFRTRGGLLSPRFLDLDVPSRYVRVPPGEQARVDFEDVVVNRQTPKSGSSIFQAADLVFYLYADHSLLDSIMVKGVTSTNLQSGYIVDVNIPNVLIRDMLYRGEAIIHNAGPAHGGVESDKFFFEETTGVLNMDEFRVEIPAFSELRHTFEYRPKITGRQTLNFVFSYNNPFNRKLLDTYQYDVYIVDGVSSYIDQIIHPPEVKFGEEFDVTVVIKNLGPSRQVNMNLYVPGILDAPVKHFIDLSPQSTVVKSFTFEAVGQGINTISVELFPHESAQNEGKNYDPYSEGDLIHKKESSFMIITPLVEGVSVEGVAEEDEMVFIEPIIPLPKAKSVQEQVVYPKEAKEARLIDPGLAIIVVLLVILIILIARLLWGPQNKF